VERRRRAGGAGGCERIGGFEEWKGMLGYVVLIVGIGVVGIFGVGAGERSRRSRFGAQAA
jgi:hypothetical protein